MRETFKNTGYHLDKALFTKTECREILKGIKEEDYLAKPTWSKSCAVVMPSWAALARNDRIVNRVAEILGDDVVLWGASLVERVPGQLHQWHNDLESSGKEGFVSVWMGLDKTDASTSLKIVNGSHESPQLLKQFAVDEGISSEEINDEKIIEWATTFQENSHINFLDTCDGDALFFDGRLWHGSSNQSHLKKRVAILLQYARADIPVRIPQLLHDRWPVEFFKAPKPPCILVRGSNPGNANHIVSGPSANLAIKSEGISTLIEHIDCSPNVSQKTDFQSYSLVNGPSPEMRLMEIHYSVLAPGKSPHPPHVHDEEEILIIIKGEAELQVESSKGSNQLELLTAHPGDFIYYPGNWRHTIKNVSDTPVIYLMLKWMSDEYHSDQSLERVFTKSSDLLAGGDEFSGDQQMEIILEGKTNFLRKLQVHTTQMKPNAGYAPHKDGYDVGIVLLEGEVETLGEKVTAPAFIYYAAGEPHGLTCTSDTMAQYIVFEFHGKHGDIYEHPKFRRRRKLKEALTNPGLLFNHLKWVINHKLGK